MTMKKDNFNVNWYFNSVTHQLFDIKVTNPVDNYYDSLVRQSMHVSVRSKSPFHVTIERTFRTYFKIHYQPVKVGLNRPI